MGAMAGPTERARAAFPLAEGPAPAPRLSCSGAAAGAGGARGQPRLSGVPCCLPTRRPLHHGPVLAPAPWGPTANSRGWSWAGSSMGTGGPCPGGAVWGAHACAHTCTGSTSSCLPRGPAGVGRLAGACWDPGPARHRAQPHGPALCPVSCAHDQGRGWKAWPGAADPLDVVSWRSRIRPDPAGRMEGQRERGGSVSAPVGLGPGLSSPDWAGAQWGALGAWLHPGMALKGTGDSGGAPAPSSTLLSPCVPQMPSTCHPWRR